MKIRKHFSGLAQALHAKFGAPPQQPMATATLPAFEKAAMPPAPPAEAPPSQVQPNTVQAKSKAPKKASPSLLLVRASEMTPLPITWLWPGWLARGKLQLLAGAPGQGKTTLALSVAAIVSAGGQWPDGTRSEAGKVLIWSGEDDPEDTLLPRLLTMGADRSQIYFVKGVQVGEDEHPFDPAHDLATLNEAAVRIGDVRLIIVDPIVSAVNGDSHRNTEVRRSLQPLVDIAARLNAAVLGISHLSKGTAGLDPIERVTGSVAFTAVVRVVWLAAKTRGIDGEENRILVRAKSNIGPDNGGFTYSIEEMEAAPGIQASRVAWGESIEGAARDLLARAEEGLNEDGTSPKEIDSFVKSCLAPGPVPAKTMKLETQGAGYSWDQVKRAATRLGVDRKKDGMQGGWIWVLPRSNPD